MIGLYKKYRVWIIATVISLFTHLALASILIESKSQAVVAGGSKISIAVMGDGAVDALMAGNISPEPKTEDVSQNEPERQIVADRQSEELPQDEPEQVEDELSSDVSALISPVTASMLSQELAPEISSELISEIVPQAKPIMVSKLQAEPVLSVAKEIVEPTKKTTEKNAVSDKPNKNTKKKAVSKPKTKPIKKTVKKTKPKKLKAKKTNNKIKKHTKVKKPNSKSSSGKKGKNKANRKKGIQEGKRKKGSISSKSKGKSKNAGNGNLTNYKGRVRRKIYRAFKPGRQRQARRDAIVSFKIRKNGQASSIRLVRSSGNKKLDNAALKAVQRAAPFPQLPNGKTSLVLSVLMNAR